MLVSAGFVSAAQAGLAQLRTRWEEAEWRVWWVQLTKLGVGRPVGKQRADGESGKKLPSRARAGSVLGMLLKQL